MAIAALPMEGDEQAMLIAAKCRGLMVGYDARWRGAGWETLSVEEKFLLPVINPETGAASRTFQQGGKYDGVIRRSDKNYLLEHKTTSDDITDPNSIYWRRLTIDSQVSAYVLANWQSGRKLDGTVYDVIRKPGIRPKQITKADYQTIQSEGTYCGWKIPEDVLPLIQDARQVEPMELYAMRLATDTLNEPEKYFQRRVIPRMDSEIVEYAQEVWEVGQSIIHARNREAHYRNSDACSQYGSPCAFLGICSGYDTHDSQNWKRSESIHPELSEVAIEDQRNVLTNSRIKTFQTCRRKHFYRYEMGIERHDEETKDALFFGSMLHSALESWWSAFTVKGLSYDGIANAAAGTELAAATREAWRETELPFGSDD